MPKAILCIRIAGVLALALPATEAPAQAPDTDTTRVAILYSGRSLGALGSRRSQSEHELLTAQANAERQEFKLVSHMAWRAPGVVVFLSGREPEGSELAFTIQNRATAEPLPDVRALRSANVLLFQDPWRPAPDLLAMLERNPARQIEYPDLVETRVRVSRLRSPDDGRIYIVEEDDASWPADARAWQVGEMNRVDIGESRVFELPLNLGQMGARATLLRAMRDGSASPAISASAGGAGTLVITADLGHQEGDLGLARPDRARVDFTALRELGYSMVVPFEMELALGLPGLVALRNEFPAIALLASNVVAADTTLFTRRLVLRAGDVRLGVLGLVHNGLRDRLPRGTLRDFTFEDPVTSARREVAALRALGVDAVVALSNMDASDNALVADRVAGVDAIVADLPVRWAPEVVRHRVELPDRPHARPGAPALVARSAANGIALGRLDLEFVRRAGTTRPTLAAVAHELQPVSDRVAPDTALVARLAEMADRAARPRGELMFPSFLELSDRHPELRRYDDVTALGRVSQPMWESFMARLLRRRANAEVSVIRRLEQFPPLIGKLHENEIDGWLWTADQVVVLDVLGSDLLALVRSDARGTLATSGIDPVQRTVQGRRIDQRTYYRVATVDVLNEGRGELRGGRRVRRRFRLSDDGALEARESGQSIAVRDLVLDELRRTRREARGGEYLDRIAALVRPDERHVSLLAFTFDRPTLWVSLNQVRGRDGYGSVTESRLSAQDAWVVGSSGRFVISHERRRSATDLGFTLAYARQGVTTSGQSQVGESADDLKIDMTIRPPSASAGSGRISPFARALLDTEFTPTEDPGTRLRNPRQLAGRFSAGVLAAPGGHWRRLELAIAVENDFNAPNVQVGSQAVLEMLRPVGVPGRGGAPFATYRWRNDATYLLPSKGDSPSSLGLRYNMLHEVAIPLLDELSLSVAADMYVFRGKVPATRHLATSTLLRVGVTYDRLWKPRYQPFI